MYKINYYWQYQPDNSDTELLDDPLLIIRDLSEVIIQLRWSVSPEPIKQSCSTMFNEYIEGIFTRKKEFDLTTLSQNNSFEYRLLNDDEYKREHNNFIAQQLLPIFETNPNLWKEIFLIRTYNSSDLNTFFKKWSSDSSAENKDSILMIKQLFFN